MHAPLRDRVQSGAVAVACAGVLGLARWLEPAPEGHGTHRGLGLPACSFFTLTGHPCPMCGATTTFALLADGHLVAGVLNQPFASLLFLLVSCALGVAVAEVLQPRGRWGRLEVLVAGREGWLAGAALVAMIASWAAKLASTAS